jgi:hypothetical protein
MLDVAARAGFPASSIYVDRITPHIPLVLAHPPRGLAPSSSHVKFIASQLIYCLS